MQFNFFSCWDCGTRVIGSHDNGSLFALPNMREVKFGLSNGAYMQNPFCAACAERAWTPARMSEFKAAVDAVSPAVRNLQITGTETVLPAPQSVAGVAR